MAKNLKLNVKNAQLAEALKINQLRKPTSSKTVKKAETESADSFDATKAPKAGIDLPPVAVVSSQNALRLDNANTP